MELGACASEIRGGGLGILVVEMAGEDPAVIDIGEQKAKKYVALRIRLTLVSVCL